MRDPTETAQEALPACVPTKLCNAAAQPPSPPQASSSSGAGGRAAIVVVIDANASNLRFFYGKNVAKAYTSQIGLLLRLLTSLRMINTTLPIEVLVSGYRIAEIERQLVASFGVTILPPERAPPVRIPSWGSKYAALRSSDLSAAEWRAAHILHDPNLLRKAARDGWKDAKMAEKLAAVDVAAAPEGAKLSPLFASAATKAKATSAAKKPKSRRHRGRS